MTTFLEGKVRELVHKHGLDDPSWIFKLKDGDEPPIFTGLSEVQFLSALPYDVRNTLVLKVMLEAFSLMQNAIEERHLRADDTMFACITIHDFDYVSSNESPIPRFALYVEPKRDDMNPSFYLLAPYTTQALDVFRWLQCAGPEHVERFVVLEDPADTDPDFRRVYVGPRVTGSGFSSVASFERR